MSHVPSPQRPSKALARGGVVVWLTGLPASGKSTLASALRAHLTEASIPACVIDGDELRAGLCSDLGFSEADRRENVRRAAEMAWLLAEQGMVAIVALVSPSIRDRQSACSGIPRERFLQVHVDCSVEVCRQRDPKGLYERATRGEIRDFTGVSAPYEAPPKPDLHIRTDMEQQATSVAALVKAVHRSLELIRRSPRAGGQDAAHEPRGGMGSESNGAT